MCITNYMARHAIGCRRYWPQFSSTSACPQPSLPRSHYHTSSHSAHRLCRCFAFTCKEVPLIVNIGISSLNLPQAHLTRQQTASSTSPPGLNITKVTECINIFQNQQWHSLSCYLTSRHWQLHLDIFHI